MPEFERAWREFFGSAAAAHARGVAQNPLAIEKPALIGGAAVLYPVDEIVSISTNDSAQRGLALIQNLALIGDSLPERE